MKLLNRKYSLIIMLVIFVSSCTYHQSSVSLIGTYKSYTPKFSFKKYSIGDNLTLKSDSNFIYENCGNISTGFWRLNSSNDSVLLFCVDFKYKNDSLNRINKVHCNPSIPLEIFYIESDGILINEFIAKKSKYFTSLKKIK